MASFETLICPRLPVATVAVVVAAVERSAVETVGRAVKLWWKEVAASDWVLPASSLLSDQMFASPAYQNPS